MVCWNSSGDQDVQHTACVSAFPFCDFGNGNLMLMVMAMASFQRLFMSTHAASPGPPCMAQPEPEGTIVGFSRLCIGLVEVC